MRYLAGISLIVSIFFDFLRFLTKHLCLTLDQHQTFHRQGMKRLTLDTITEAKLKNGGCNFNRAGNQCFELVILLSFAGRLDL